MYIYKNYINIFEIIEVAKMEKYVNLYRLWGSDQGTQGVLTFPGFKCYTMEPPWRDNQTSISCIPEATYDVEVKYSQKYKNVYWVKNVDGRHYILLHSGNYGGDKSLGYRTHTEGCILLGKTRGILAGQQAILNSRIMVRKFNNLLRFEPFTLTIYDFTGLMPGLIS